MGELLSLLELMGRKRHLLSSEESLTPGRAFSLVRDMPYRRASSRKPEAIVLEWQGTCSGKHYLLADIFREMGMDSRIIMCTHRFTLENICHFPSELREIVAAGPIPDVHTYLQLKTRRGWMIVDATWPSKAERLGMSINHSFIWGKDMKLACDPIQRFHVPVGQDPQEYKERLINRFCGEQRTLRDRFIEDLGQWLSETT